MNDLSLEKILYLRLGEDGKQISRIFHLCCSQNRLAAIQDVVKDIIWLDCWVEGDEMLDFAISCDSTYLKFEALIQDDSFAIRIEVTEFVH